LLGATPGPEAAALGAYDRYAFRVPAVVVAPFARRKYVSHVVHDHTSILKLVERKCNLAALTDRDANADDLIDTLDLRGRPAWSGSPPRPSPGWPPPARATEEAYARLARRPTDRAESHIRRDREHTLNEPDTSMLRPRPVPDELTKPFWDGVARHELVIQRCRDCGHYVHPPFPECTACQSQDFVFEPVSGRGTIFERAIVESPVVVGYEKDVPYACLLVELEEQMHLLVAGNLVDAGPRDAEVGKPVEVVFVEEPDGFTLPKFRLAGGRS
jgi:uncharacterized OB-fold protein